MKNPARIRTLHRQVIALAAVACALPSARAQFNKTAAGTYDYLDTANWNGGNINNTFSSSPAGNQTITFGANHTLGSSLSISNTGLFNHTFTGSGGDRTLTLGGNISLGGSTSNANTVTIGSLTDGQKLNIDLGGATRTLSVGTNRTLDVLNVISGANSIIKTGTGTLKLTNAANSYTGSTSIGTSGQSTGVLEVTKLANGGQASSIGASNNGNSNLVFGGTSTGTLRYIGSGDSTDRRFLIGGVGAIFDASGSGAINWTNTAAATYASTGSPRTITFKGSNTGGNTMAASFTDSGAGQTSILKQDAGRWILSGTNTYTGNTTIDAGTLELGSSGSGGNSSNLVLNGGTFATGGFDETFGTLALNGDATIDFGSSNTSDLIFAASDGVSWAPSVSLSIINFNEGFDTIRFGTSQAGLTISQLGKVTINGFAAAIDEQGFLSISAVPEPSAFAALAGLSILGFTATRRRRR